MLGMSNTNIRYFSPPDKVQREKLLEMLLSDLDGMVYRSRIDEQWTLEFVSKGCLSLTGYKPEFLLMNSRVSYEEITHRDDRARVRREIQEAIEQNRPFNIEYRIYHADGSIRWVWECGRGMNQADEKVEFVHGYVQDITLRHRHEVALAEAEYRYRSIFENATEGIFQTTQDGYYLQVNPALAKIYGYDSPMELMDALRDIREQLYVDPQRRDEFIQLMLEQGAVTNFESRVYKRDRSIIWISENARTVHAPDGRLMYYEGTVEDITARKSYEEHISHQATHDSLTNLPNRMLLTDRLQQMIQNAVREEVQLAILFIDLDHFKNVNDTLGHAAGDELIKLIADRLRKCMRDGDTVARIGGDEFVLLLPNIHTSTEMISHAVKRILNMIQKPCMIEDREFLVSCSIGISIYPDDGRDAETLLKNADMAMYQAKQAGRNNFQFFTEELNRIVVESLELEQQLRQALSAGQFELHYQPKVTISTGKVTGAEALVRWRAPHRGLVSPARFIPLAEETGLIEPLGAWVLDAACKQIKSWAERGLPVVPVSVNLSPRQFNQPGLIDNVKHMLQKYLLPAELLVIEITESCMVNDARKFLRTLEDMKALGLQIAIDDFGSGYSNLSHLKTMPVDYLKADSSFVNGIENNDKGRAIYRAIISMAHNLNLKVIAEGVETQMQYEFLRSIGCDAIQGYYFSMPLTPENFEHLLVS